jgi:hypothetical protein
MLLFDISIEPERAADAAERADGLLQAVEITMRRFYKETK